MICLGLSSGWCYYSFSFSGGGNRGSGRQKDQVSVFDSPAKSPASPHEEASRYQAFVACKNKYINGFNGSDCRSSSFPSTCSYISLNRKHTHGGQTSKQLKRTKVIYSFPYVLLRFAGGDPGAGWENFSLVSRESLTVPIGLASGLLIPRRSLHSTPGWTPGKSHQGHITPL